MMTCMTVKLIMLRIIIIIMKKGYHHRGDGNVSTHGNDCNCWPCSLLYSTCTLCNPFYFSHSLSLSLFLLPFLTLSLSLSLSLSPFFPARGRLPRQPFEVSEDPPVSPLRSYSKKASQSLSKLITIIIINRLVMQAQLILF